MARIRWVLLAATLFVVMQAGTLVAFRSIVPDDPIFSRHEFDTEYRTKMRQVWIAASIMGAPILIASTAVILMYFEGLMSTWDKYGLVLVALIVTPFLLPGFTAGREERGILRRDESYPGFIRCLLYTSDAADE